MPSKSKRDRSRWGDGDLLAPWAEGDVVNIPADSPAFADGRIPHSWSKHPELSPPGRYKVVGVYSIGEGDEWQIRVCPMQGRKVLWEESSDRIHMIPGVCNYTEGWTLLKSSDPDNAGREWPSPDEIVKLRAAAFPHG